MVDVVLVDVVLVDVVVEEELVGVLLVVVPIEWPAAGVACEDRSLRLSGGAVVV